MKHEVKKISKIIDEIITYCFLHKAHLMDIHVERHKDHFEMLFSTDIVHLSEEEMERLREVFSVARQDEFDHYWMLTGETEDSTELNLVGMMIDRASVEIKENRLMLRLIRDIH